jgi:L-fuconolactonase
MQRRVFLTGAAAMVAAPVFAADAIPVIDTHVHLFDPRRPQGVPYAGPKGQPPQIALPETYRRQIGGTGIVGAIVVEASPWIEDNLWILERANSDPLFVGVVGSLDPSRPEFGDYLNRFSKDPLWRGIRYARVWQMENGKQVLKPGMAEGLKLLAQTGQTLDMANPSFDLLRGALLDGRRARTACGDGSHALAGPQAGNTGTL